MSPMKLGRISTAEFVENRKMLIVFLAIGLLAFTTVMVTQGQFVASDPGPRPGPAGAGGPLPSVGADSTLISFFNDGQDRFEEIDSVSGKLPGEAGAGLGPTFNSNSCASCHAQPAVGGTSPSPYSPQNPAPNPLVAVATLDGATNTVPYFISRDGPVRGARFKFLLSVTARSAVPRMAACTTSTPSRAAWTRPTPLESPVSRKPVLSGSRTSSECRTSTTRSSAFPHRFLAAV